MKKSLWIIGVLLTLVVCLLLLGNAVWVARSGSQLAKSRAVVAAEDANYRAQAAAQSPLSAEQNAYTYIVRCETSSEAAMTDLNDYYSPEAEEVPLTEKDRQIIEAAVAAHPEVLALLAQAAACPGYDSKLDYSQGISLLLPHVSTVRNMARVANVQGRVHIANGEPDKALELSCQTLALSQHMEQEPILISYLVAMATRSIGNSLANEAIRSGPTSPELRKQLDQQLAAADTLRPLVTAMRAERAMGVTTFQQLRTGQLNAQTLGGVGSGGLPEILQNWVTRRFLNSDEAFYIDLMNQVVKDVGAPYPKAKASAAAIQAQLQPQSITHSVSSMLFTDMMSMRNAAERQRARDRALRVLIASVGEDNTLPASFKIEDISLPAAAKEDPFTGQPLRVKSTPDGPVVYSVGVDQTDDNGDITDTQLDVGMGPLKPAPAATQETAESTEEDTAAETDEP